MQSYPALLIFLPFLCIFIGARICNNYDLYCRLITLRTLGAKLYLYHYDRVSYFYGLLVAHLSFANLSGCIFVRLHIYRMHKCLAHLSPHLQNNDWIYSYIPTYVNIQCVLIIITITHQTVDSFNKIFLINLSFCLKLFAIHHSNYRIGFIDLMHDHSLWHI